MTTRIKFDVDEKIISDRVKQWEAAWNIGSEKFSMDRFGNLYAQDESLLAYDLTSPQTPSIIRGYTQYVKVWDPFMQAFSPWHAQVNDDLVIRVSNSIAVATAYDYPPIQRRLGFVLDNNGNAIEFSGPMKGKASSS